jgi:hypothetical protein
MRNKFVHNTTDFIDPITYTWKIICSQSVYNRAQCILVHAQLGYAIRSRNSRLMFRIFPSTV